MHATDGLTRAQRFHFDAHGYVLLRGALDPDLVARAKDALYRIRAEPDPMAHRIYTNARRPHVFHFGNLVEYDPALLEYATHPKLIACVREVVGGDVRLEESEAIINARNPDRDLSGDTRRSVPTGFHTGTRHGFGTWEEGGRFHCLFVKTLAFLTDVGPDDGGTAVIPGSHRMTWPQSEMIAAAQEDPSLVVQVEAKAGDVLLFPESLIHSTTEIRSDNERVILVSGYTPPMLREWPGNEVRPEFYRALPDDIRPIISGEQSWHWKRNP